MVRLTSNAPKKEEILHPLSMHDVTSHPLDNSNPFEDVTASGDRSSGAHKDHIPEISVATVALKDNARSSNGEVNSNAPNENQDQSRETQAKGMTSQKHVADSSAQIIHPPSSNFAAKHKKLSQLPRSVRWRLSLGLLTDPSDGEENEVDAISTAISKKSSSSGGKPTCIQQMVQEDKFHANPTMQLKSIQEVNALKLRFQRSRYEELEKRHYWSHTPVGIAGKTESTQQDPTEAATPAATTTTTQHVAKGDDPLSALLDSPPEDKGLFGFGAKRRPKKGTAISNNSMHSTSTKSSKTEKETTQSSPKQEEEGRGGDKSKWADFYSTREMLDVIEKDLNRLPSDHYTVYHSWRKRCTEWREKKSVDEKKRMDEKDKVALGPDRKGVEPMQTQQRQNNRPLKKRFANTLGQSLNIGRNPRLVGTPEDDEEEDATKKAEAAEKLEIEISTKERAEKLSQLLFVYGQEHEDIGYRQGMHEILSYILLALEIDLMESAIAKERRQWRNDMLSPHDVGGNSVDGGLAGVDASGNIVVVHLLDPDYIMHDAFTLFECVMESLALAYDVQEGGDGTSAGCLEGMTSSIVSKIRYIARDEALFSHVLYMPVPPQLYFAKWVRLMFGREVAGGMDAVLGLWDAFFELASATASMDEDMSVSNALMNVLKTAAAAMILLIRHLLLAPTVAWDGSLTGDPDPNDGIQYLMNYPPIEDTGVFVKTVTSLLAKEKLLTAQSAQNDGSLQRIKSRRFQRMTSDLPMVAIENQQDNQEDDKEDTASRSSSCGNFMGWPSQPESNELDVSFTRQTGQHSSGADNSSVQNNAHNNKLDISETIGNFASGLLGLAGNFTSQKQPMGLTRRASFSRTSFTGFRGLGENEDDKLKDNGEAQHDFEFDIHQKDDDSNVIQVLHTDLNDNEAREGNAQTHPRRRSMSIESGLSSADDLNASFTSYSSRTASRSLAESIRQDPTVWATKLERSVNTLMKHFHEQMRAQSDTPPPNNNSAHSTGSHRPMIPEEVWHAMADIDQVRKDLLSQSATEKLDKSPSSLMLSTLDANFNKMQRSMSEDNE
ncbi:hypothetical protein ACHAXN_011613 [Cyclotella atomus]